MKDILDELKEEIFRYYLPWIPTPSVLNPPEFVGTFQKRMSIIDSKMNVSQKLIEKNEVQLKKYEKCYDFIRTFLSQQNKYENLGKVSFWKIEKEGYVGSHADTYTYHYLIDRYLLNFTMKNETCDIILNGKKINSEPGFMHFLDHTKTHSVVNNQCEDVYFLTFDVFKRHII